MNCPHCKAAVPLRNVEDEIEWNVSQSYRIGCPSCGGRIEVAIEVQHNYRIRAHRDLDFNPDEDEDESDWIVEKA